MRKCSMCQCTMDDECFIKPNGDFYKTCIDCRNYSREYSKWYSATHPEVRRESRKKYKKSAKGQAAEKRYRMGENGIATHKRAKEKYRNSTEGKETERTYANSKNGRYKIKYAVQIRARSAISNAIRDGVITRPHNCEICDRVAKLHAHHNQGWEEEYHYDVWWVCNKCDPSTKSLLVHDGSMSLKQAKMIVIPSPAD